MEGVKFALEDEDGNVLRELASGEDGIVHADDLKPGVYVIREIETQAGYRLTEETIRVVIDENYIVPDELFRLVNFPEEERPRDEIQTGVDVPVTPMMLYGLISMAPCGKRATMRRAPPIASTNRRRVLTYRSVWLSILERATGWRPSVAATGCWVSSRALRSVCSGISARSCR